MKTIDIIVSPKGETQIETKGFAGSECQQASRFLEQALGRRTDETLTREFFEFLTTQQDQQQRN
ncbi:MAG: DUF2997 domain-containing protein [Planctomycetes bacterium]|nr:DUF2997 domain-containing protein [Planctomycetota bacterium]